MEHLGKVFREFRTSGKYSLKEAAGESCSTSQLSRFELGESDLAVSRFFEILDNIHVTTKISWIRQESFTIMNMLP